MAVSGFASSILSKIHEIVSGGAVSILHNYNGRNDAVAGPSNMMQIQVLSDPSIDKVSYVVFYPVLCTLFCYIFPFSHYRSDFYLEVIFFLF